MGWLLDSFDVMLYALVLATLMVDLNMSTTTGGSLASVTLAASAVGGIFFGVFADRFGRVRALIWSILIYSVFTAACGFAQSVRQLAVFRVCLGFGMGGEWASGAALISETWPAEHRGKALGLMQSSWAIGYAAAAAVTALVLPSLGWRAVFFIGILPAFFTVWGRRRLEEPEIWQVSVRDPRGRFSAIFGPDLRGLTVALTLMNACIMFAWWGFNLWIPAYLSLPVEDGGIGLSTYAKSGLIIAMQIGMWLGYVLFGVVRDRVGRKRTYVVYVLTAAALTLAYTSTRNPMALLVLGPFVAFFGTGSFSGFGAVTAEIYPTEVRATAQGFTYNIGRLASAVAPWVIGSLAETRGFTAALSITAGAFVLAAVFWLWIPETRGRELT